LRPREIAYHSGVARHSPFGPSVKAASFMSRPRAIRPFAISTLATALSASSLTGWAAIRCSQVRPRSSRTDSNSGFASRPARTPATSNAFTLSVRRVLEAMAR
jgi:hypothetical protein